MLTAVVVACGLHFPCDVPTPPVKHPAAHVTKHHEPIKHFDVVVKVPTNHWPNAPSDFDPPTPVFTPGEGWVPHIPSVEPLVEKKKEGKSVMQYLESAYSWVSGLSWPVLVLGLVVLYYTAKHGWPWVQQKATSIWNSIVGDWKAIEARVSALELATRPAPVASVPAAPTAA